LGYKELTAIFWRCKNLSGSEVVNSGQQAL
jgi:hypothetical protein